jgi:hypothetical protein
VQAPNAAVVLGHEEAAHEALAKMAKISPTMARDLTSVYRRFQPTDQIFDALMTGLRSAGWTEFPPRQRLPRAAKLGYGIN